MFIFWETANGFLVVLWPFMDLVDTAKRVGVNWLGILPSDIPHARLSSWSYDDNNHSTSGSWPGQLYEHARNLVHDLELKRKLTKVLLVLQILKGMIFANE